MNTESVSLPDKALALERAYYLPQGKTLQLKWAGSGSQNTYADLCQRGHTIIAQKIIEGIKSGYPPSIAHLYQVAAQVRRAIAILNQYEKGSWILYGQAGVPVDDACLIDWIKPTPPNWPEHFQTARQQFNHLLTLMNPERFQKAFGEEYSFRVIDEPPAKTIEISYKESHRPIALLKSSPDELKMGHAADYGALLAKADTHFAAIVENQRQGVTASDVFWREMGTISLDLFHAGPLKLGSQTATLMVLAGITKAMGYEVLPRKLETDHFIEAELTPYTQYIEQYGSRFIRVPVHTEPPASLKTDDTFLMQAREAMKKRYASIAQPLERLERYLSELQTAPFVLPPDMGKVITVTDLAVNGKTIKSLRIEPKDKQHEIDYLLAFMDHSELIDMFELPQGKLERSRSSGAIKYYPPRGAGR